MPNLGWARLILERQDAAGNTVQTWLIALAVVLLVLLVLRLLKSLLTRRARILAERTGRPWIELVQVLLQSTRLWFLLIVAVFCGGLVLQLPARVDAILDSVVVVVLLLQGALWGNLLIGFSINRYMKERMETDAASVTTLAALAFLGRLVLWSVVVLLALDNVGIDVTAMIAGLGIGGIAVALAAQNILGDLFASLSIVLDKPFVLGDFIIVGEHLGTVEHIGLKTTRLRSIGGEQLIFSNNDLLQSRVRNFKRMWERRILFTLGVTYQTPAEKLERIPQMVRAAVEAQDKTRFDRAHFKSYGDFSLVFEVVYYVLVPDFNIYMDIHQAINLTLYRQFAEEGIEFAYPTQTLFVQQESVGEKK